MYFVNLNILRCNFIKKDVIPNILLTLAFFYHRTGSSLCLERDAGCKEPSELPRNVFNLDHFQTQISMVNNFLRASYNAESVQRILISKPLYTGHNEEGKKVHSFG